MNEQTEEEPRKIGVVPLPPLSWVCECGNPGMIFDPRAITAYMSGRTVGGIKCAKCGVEIVLVHPQESKILTPDSLNRKMRRIIKANGCQ